MFCTRVYRGFYPESRPHQSCPPLYVLPKLIGTTRFPRPLLIKPDRTFNEIIQGFFGDGKPFKVEVIAQKIKSTFGSANQGLMQRCLYANFV